MPSQRSDSFDERAILLAMLGIGLTGWEGNVRDDNWRWRVSSAILRLIPSRLELFSYRGLGGESVADMMRAAAKCIAYLLLSMWTKILLLP